LDSEKETTTMIIDNIEQNELTASERGVLADDRERWSRMGRGAHLDDWLNFGPGLTIRRRLAMHIAHSNKPEGRAYSDAFKQLMEHDGLDGMDKTSISAVLWLHDEAGRLTILRQIRETLPVGKRARLNSPISARQRVEQVLKARATGSEEFVRQSPVSNLKRQVAEKDREIAQLREKLMKVEARDGSRFDLNRDSAEDIGRVIVGSIGESKARKIAKVIEEGLKAKHQTKSKEQNPAG
jgi:hypothetical protein